MMVSVVIPTYNEEANIRQCLESLLGQDYKPLEIIVVDDGSVDQTLELIKDLRVKVLKQSHKGPAKARNLGAKEAHGQILVFMDADMTFSKSFIKDLVGPVIKGDYKGTFSKEEYVSNWDNVWARCWNYNRGISSSRMIPDNYPDEGLDFRAILKSEFEKVGGFDDTGYTDTWTLSQKLGYKPHSVSGAKYFHNNPDNLSEVFVQAKWVAKREYKFGKLLALVKFSLPVSLLAGLIKSVRFKEPLFLLFKLVYDFGSFLGLLEMSRGKLSK